MAIEIDARVLAEGYMDDARRRMSDAVQGGRDRLPRLDVFLTDGSSVQFLRSIRRKCSDLGVSVVEHEVPVDVDADLLSAMVGEVVDFGDSDGVVFIRPPYRPSIREELDSLNGAFIDSIPERYDVDRIGFEGNGGYPPVARAVGDVLDYSAMQGYVLPGYSRTVMIGTSPYVGIPISKLLTSMCRERVVRHALHHASGDPDLISFDTEDADVVCTYRDVDDLRLNPDSLIVDVGNDGLLSKVGDRVRYCTSHLGQLTTAILISNLVDSYVMGRVS